MAMIHLNYSIGIIGIDSVAVVSAGVFSY